MSALSEISTNALNSALAAKLSLKESKPVEVNTIKSREHEEPLLQANPRRFVLFPIQYHGK